MQRAKETCTRQSYAISFNENDVIKSHTAGLPGISVNYVPGINQQVAASDVTVHTAFFVYILWNDGKVTDVTEHQPAGLPEVKPNQ